MQEPERPDLRGDHGVRADLAVVADVHEIIELDAFGDARVVERTAVDGGVRADFHIVGDFDNSCLRKFPILPFSLRVTETVCADDCSGMNLHAMADAHAGVESDSRMNAAVFANPATCSDYGMCADLCACADVGVLSDDGVGTDARARGDAGQRSNDGGRMNAGGDGRPPEE